MNKTKLIKCVSIASMALVLGFTSLIAINQDNSIKAAEANSVKSYTGFYKKVTDVSDIHDGDYIFFVADNGHIVRDIGGNPAYLYTKNEGVHIDTTNDLLFLDNAYVTPHKVETGYVANSFAFYGEYKPYKRYDIKGYLSYDRRGSNTSNPGPHDYTGSDAGIGYWYGGFALRKSKDLAESSFTMEYEDGHMIVNNCAGHGMLSWTSGYDKRLCYANYSNINVYKIDNTPVSVSSIQVLQQPSHGAYNQGDKLDLKDLEVRVNLSNGDHFTASYNATPQFFQHYPYVTGTGSTTNIVDFLYGGSFNVNVTVRSAQGSYGKVTTDLYDYRGNSYVIAILGSYYPDGDGDYHYSDARALNNISKGEEYGQSTSIYYNVPDGDTVEGPNDNCRFKIVMNNGNYYLKDVDNDKYISAADLSPSDSPTTPIKVVFESGEAHIKNPSNDYYLREVGGGFAFSSSGTKAALFKKAMPQESITNVSNFLFSHDAVTGLSEFLDSATADNETYTISAGDWSTYASRFNALSLDEQGSIAGLTYTTHNGEKEDSPQEAMDRYDYVVSKYKLNDFMNRKEAGTYQNNYHPQLNDYFKLINDTNDYRGSYALVILGSQSGQTYPDAIALNDEGTGTNITDFISGEGESVLDIEATVEVQVVISGSNYYLRAKNHNADGYHYISSPDCSSSNTPTSAVTFEYDDVNEQIYVKCGDLYLQRNGNNFVFSNGANEKATLYKLEATESVNDEVSTFLSGFSTYLGSCSAEHDQSFITEENWGDFATSFNALSPDAQGYLANVEYDHNQEERNSVADLIDRYDYIVDKYHVNDFIGRASIREHLQPQSNTNMNIVQFTDMSVIIVVITSISLILVAGGLFIAKKKRAQ